MAGGAAVRAATKSILRPTTLYVIQHDGTAASPTIVSVHTVPVTQSASKHHYDVMTVKHTFVFGGILELKNLI